MPNKRDRYELLPWEPRWDEPESPKPAVVYATDPLPVTHIYGPDGKPLPLSAPKPPLAFGFRPEDAK